MRSSREEQALVLVVERDCRHQGSLTSVSKKLNVRVNRVADFREAIDCLMSSSYSFLFIDVESDNVEALACIKTIRMNAARLGRTITIVATITNLDSDGQRRLRECGVADIIETPLTVSKLQAVLSRSSTAVA